MTSSSTGLGLIKPISYTLILFPCIPREFCYLCLGVYGARGDERLLYDPALDLRGISCIPVQIWWRYLTNQPSPLDVSTQETWTFYDVDGAINILWEHLNGGKLTVLSLTLEIDDIKQTLGYNTRIWTIPLPTKTIAQSLPSFRS